MIVPVAVALAIAGTVVPTCSVKGIVNNDEDAPDCGGLCDIDCPRDRGRRGETGTSRE